jgi:hypothetical protein
MSPSPRRFPSHPGCGHRRHVDRGTALSAVRIPAAKVMSRLAPALPRLAGPARCPAGDGGARCGDGVGGRRRRTESGVRRTAMGLTRRQRRELAAMGEQLGREDPTADGRLRRRAVGSDGDHGRRHHVDDLLDSLAVRAGADSALTTSSASSSASQPASCPGVH